MIILYGRGYDSQDLVGRQVKLLTERKYQYRAFKIIAVNHYGFIVDGVVQMYHWCDMDKIWSWIDAPEGHR